MTVYTGSVLDFLEVDRNIGFVRFVYTRQVDIKNE